MKSTLISLVVFIFCSISTVKANPNAIKNSSIPTVIELEKQFVVIQFGAFSNYKNATKLKSQLETTLEVELIIHEDDTKLFKVLFTNDIDDTELALLVNKMQLNELKYFIKNKPVD